MKFLLLSFLLFEFCITFLSQNVYADSSEYFLNKAKRLTATKSHMVEFDTLDDNLSITSKKYIDMEKTVIYLCLTPFNKQLALMYENINSKNLTKNNYKSTVLSMVSLMNKAEEDVIKCGAKKGVLVRPLVVTNEGEFSYSNWLKSTLLAMQSLEISLEDDVERARKSRENSIALVGACGKTYNYDVDGTCGSESVEGNVDACSNNKRVTGTIEYSNGNEFDFNGRWVSQGEIDGQDGFGNNCDLEVR